MTTSDEQRRREILDEASWAECPDAPPAWADGYLYGAEWGAGWMAAIIGMAQAIRDAHLCRSCLDIYSADSDGTCQRCGHPHGWTAP